MSHEGHEAINANRSRKTFVGFVGFVSVVVRHVTAAAVLRSVGATRVDAQWLKQPTRGIPRTRDGKPKLKAPAPRVGELKGIKKN